MPITGFLCESVRIPNTLTFIAHQLCALGDVSDLVIIVKGQSVHGYYKSTEPLLECMLIVVIVN